MNPLLRLPIGNVLSSSIVLRVQALLVYRFPRRFQLHRLILPQKSIEEYSYIKRLPFFGCCRASAGRAKERVPRTRMSNGQLDVAFCSRIFLVNPKNEAIVEAVFGSFHCKQGTRKKRSSDAANRLSGRLSRSGQRKQTN